MKGCMKPQRAAIRGQSGSRLKTWHYKDGQFLCSIRAGDGCRGQPDTVHLTAHGARKLMRQIKSALGEK